MYILQFCTRQVPCRRNQQELNKETENCYAFFKNYVSDLLDIITIDEWLKVLWQLKFTAHQQNYRFDSLAPVENKTLSINFCESFVFCPIVYLATHCLSEIPHSCPWSQPHQCPTRSQSIYLMLHSNIEHLTRQNWWELKHILIYTSLTM